MEENNTNITSEAEVTETPETTETVEEIAVPAKESETELESLEGGEVSA